MSDEPITPAPPPPPPAPVPPEAPLRTFRPPSPGQIIVSGGNRYTIGQPLGQGAYGATFQCTDEWDNALVAKILVPRGRPYEEIQANWQREIALLLTFRHPNVTHVYNAFEHEDTFYIIMERCAGPIRDLFKLQNYAGQVWLLPVARCLLQGVAFIHGAGYVHKDIHAGNVFWSFVRNELIPTNSQSLTFKIGDLGISRLETEIDFFNTTLAPWMLPPEFLDPKQFGLVGRQTDLYHAALLLLAVLRGSEPAFSREEILAGAPRQAAEALGAPFGSALAKALRRHVGDRTPSAFEFWKDLSGRIDGPHNQMQLTSGAAQATDAARS